MNEVYELLPESMLNCVVNGRELRVVRISDSELTIRMTREYSDSIINYSGDNASPLFVVINIYDYYAGKYDSIIVKNTSYKSICHKQYYDEVTVEYSDEDNIINSKLTAAVNHYWRYIILKSEDYDNSFSKYMCNYPEDKDYEYPEDFVSQRENMCAEYDFNKVFSNIEPEADKKKYAIKINNYLLYDRFLTMNIKDYIVKYFKDANVSLIKDNYSRINAVYIGNSFCPNLFPDDDMLIKMINKAHDNGLDITVEYSYMRQDDIDRYSKLFDKLITWCSENSAYISNLVICQDDF